jgi:hypothetical protein
MTQPVTKNRATVSFAMATVATVISYTQMEQVNN